MYFLSSKAKFSHCRIPQLQLEKEEDDKELVEKEQERVEQRKKEMEQELLVWEKEQPLPPLSAGVSKMSDLG